MTELEVQEFTRFEEFEDAWDEKDAELAWELLGLIPEDEILVELPEWLAEENTGFVDGAIPTLFIGTIEEETEMAVKLGGSADAKSLLKLAHRIHHLEKRDGGGNNEQWLENRLTELEARFRTREDTVTLKDEWLPKSQFISVIRRTA